MTAGDTPLHTEEASVAELESQIERLHQLLEERELARQALDKRLTQLLSRVGQANICSGPNCGARVWWITHANGKKAPYDPDGTPHFATCPDSSQFHRRRV